AVLVNRWSAGVVRAVGRLRLDGGGAGLSLDGSDKESEHKNQRQKHCNVGEIASIRSAAKRSACKPLTSIRWTQGRWGLEASHFVFSPERPEVATSVRSARCSPISRPEGSYHSSKECAPPPVPPAPMEMASIPTESGMLASVEDRSIRDWLPTKLSAARMAASSGESARSSPEGRT